MVRCEQGSVPGGRARALRAFRPRRGGPVEEDQSSYRRGRPGVRRIHLQDYRDMRFSPDKSPYKTHIGIHFWHDKAGSPEHMTPGYFLHLESGESGVHSGVWHPEPRILKKIRDRIADEPDAWKTVLPSKIQPEGESLKRPPPGYDPNHPQIQDLRRKDFIASRRFRDTEVVSPGFLENFVKGCESMVPLNRFLAESMGLPW